jgi:hypothetical protein
MSRYHLYTIVITWGFYLHCESTEEGLKGCLVIESHFHNNVVVDVFLLTFDECSRVVDIGGTPELSCELLRQT